MLVKVYGSEPEGERRYTPPMAADITEKFWGSRIWSRGSIEGSRGTLMNISLEIKMTNRKKNVAIFAAGFLAGAVLASLVVGWNWRRVFEDSHSAAVAGQAHVAWMIYSGRSEELAESILSQLPTYISDIDRRLSRPPAHTLVDSWAASAYEASGQEMPQRVEEILDKWALARN